MHKSSFVVLFPILDATVRVDVGSDIVDICSTHNYVIVVTHQHIYVAHKDNLEVRLVYRNSIVNLLHKSLCLGSFIIFFLNQK